MTIELTEDRDLGHNEDTPRGYRFLAQFMDSKSDFSARYDASMTFRYDMEDLKALPGCYLPNDMKNFYNGRCGKDNRWKLVARGFRVFVRKGAKRS